jgi:predicted naringenin-chalcone synthase
MSATIIALRTATPAYRYEQAALAQMMNRLLGFDADEAQRLQALYRASGIQTRYSVLPDYGQGEPLLFPKTEDMEPVPDTVDRNRFYQHAAVELALKAAKALPDPALKGISHLITVSCTGLSAPGPDIALIHGLNLDSGVHRLAINFMGCYAALTALKQAAAICRADPKAKILVVAVELCSLHFQKNKDEDALMANALFGDGAAALVVENQEDSQGLELHDFFCDLVPEGASDMTWMPGRQGFDMRLSAYVPELLEGGMATLLKRMKQHFPVGEKPYLAIHPGGKRILQVLEQLMGRDHDDFAASYDILREFGNMSSPTVLFVLERLWKKLKAEQAAPGQILSFAFGPGLTIEAALLRWKG